ncbi:MAG: DNA helicase II, partial [Betaproteobacteria bacterium]|nr:DNA helicase II [Betaproteobacteria bacterium]
MTSDLLRGLNEQQHAAVTLPAQHALILAGAGSGKTRVLTTRIAWLIASAQVSPQGLLAVTFTNKAAREMLNRLSAMVAVNLKLMWVGTFHGLCNRMLRAHHRDAGLPASFQILDSQDQLAAIKRMLKAMQIDEDKVAPRNLMHFINACKESGQRAASVEAFDDYNRRFVELYSAYEVQCQREAVVDFAELLLRSYELLQRNQLLRDHYQLRFRHILVDEFQDTNALQYRWLKLLAGAGNAVFAVGDDDQSIYGFRGADVGNMMAFEREFRVDNLIKLEQNYRSAGHILDCANALIEQNNARLGKALWTDAGAGEPVRVQELVSDAGEAQWLVEQIKAIVRDGDRRSDVAVLYRSNAQSRVIEHALFSATIPYRVYGGLRFFERAEVKHALAYLRLIEQDDDDGAFLRVVNFPVRGIGARSLEQLQDLTKRLCSGPIQPQRQGRPSANRSAALPNLVTVQATLRQYRGPGSSPPV